MIPNEKTMQDGINYEILNEARLANDLSIEKIALFADIPEPTVKNILTGKTKNPSVKNTAAIARVVGVPLEQVLGYTPKTIIENQALKEGDSSVFALKEVYEFNIAAMKENNEAHITNIRAHYEQHHNDLVDNFEKRLADKREIIEILKEENAKLNITLEKQKKDTRTGNLIRNIIIALFVIGVITLFIMELLHPTHGWLRF